MRSSNKYSPESRERAVRMTRDSPDIGTDQNTGVPTPNESTKPINAPHPQSHQGRTYPPLARGTATV